MKRRLRRLLLAAPGFARLCRFLTRHHVRALMYHRFNENANNDTRFVNREELQHQMAYLARHHVFCGPTEHLEALQGHSIAARPCPVVVTVDDGYHDFHSVAYPVFREYGIPVMLFITSGFVDGTSWFWWDQLEYILDTAEPRSRVVTFAGREYSLDLSTVEGRQSAWHLIGDRCRFLPNAEKNESLRNLASDLDVNLPVSAPPKYCASTWDQILDMMQAGVCVGAHTVNHPILSRVSETEAYQEISESKRRLQEMTDQEIDWFCYPQGGPADFTPQIKSQLREAAFRGSYIAYQDMVRQVDPFAMPRYCITEDWDDFRWALCGAEILFLRLRRLLGLRIGAREDYWRGSV